MIIGIDGTCLQGVRSGPGWYLTRLLDPLSRILEEDKVVVWMNNPTPEERARVPENRFVSVNATHYPWAALKLTWNTLGTPSADGLMGRPADLYFYPNYLPLPQKQGKRIVFIHDTTFLTDPAMASQSSRSMGISLEKEAEGIDLFLTPSDHNRRELLQRFRGIPDAKVRVVPHGLSDAFRRPAPAEAVGKVREKYGLSRPYFLFVGTLEPRKNLLRLVHAFLLFKQKVRGDHELILAGPRGWVGEEFMHLILSPQVKDKIRWLDYVPEADMPALYSGAKAFLYPVLKEGFGLPLLESMGCGTPVVCSNAAAIPEVVGDGAWMVDPLKVEDWTQAFRRAVEDPAFLDVLKDRGRARVGLFPLDQTARQTLAAFKLAVSHA